ncbi:ComEC/Rec2 family competence protein [Bacillus anthracis]|uniref:ComEC/Rec2 family competence protein n=1 Tax=Bacillus cereus group TaxID=86661 RepID=UPI0022E97290|nr:MBL fold metallo-hydrolase [Bacillus cereus group sp. BcHK104]MDA1987128.1 MBL fold metallo-hydrolase [Bacillus cereus group sp. BcHK104]
MTLKIKALPAGDGDCLLISYQKKNILVDGGRVNKHTIRYLRRELEAIRKRNEKIDLLIITHIDNDHIEGVLAIFEMNICREIIQKVLFNTGKMIANFFNTELESERDTPISLIDQKVGVEQGNSLEKELIKYEIMPEKIIKQGDIESLENASLKILSPNIQGLVNLNEKWEVEIDYEEDVQVCKTDKKHDYLNSIRELASNKFIPDTSKVNASSIAFLFEYQGKKLLLLGDAHSSVVTEGLQKLGYNRENKLKVDIVKVSHHGSRRNTNNDLLELIDCSNFIISTDGGRNARALPDKEALSRIITLMNKPVQQEVTESQEEKESVNQEAVESQGKEKTVNFYFNYHIYDGIFSPEELHEYKICLHNLEKNNFVLEV